MLRINKTDISITRGDSAYISFSLKDNSGNPVLLQRVDRVRVQVRDKEVDGDLVFEGNINCDYDAHTIVWHIQPSDTKDINVGTYYWDGQVEFAVGSDIYTFVDVSKFIVLPEITYEEE